MTVLIGGCSQVPHEPYAVSDFKIDRAGVSKSVSFSVPTKGRDVSRGLMIALNFPAHRGNATEEVAEREPPIRLTVDEILPTGRRHVLVQDYHATLEANGHPVPLKATAMPAEPADVRLRLYAGGFDESRVLVGRFMAKPGSHYEATITTVVDLPAFRDIPVRVVADDLYNTGK